jgi:DNA-binding NtrC family response regulator
MWCSLPTGKRLYATTMPNRNKGFAMLTSQQPLKRQLSAPPNGRTDMHGTMPSRHTILIVESNNFLRLLTADVLEAAGFATLQTGNAEEALAMLEARSDIALLLTAIKMSGSMNGEELAHTVKARWPAMQIIVASGHLRTTENELPADSLFFTKPYHADMMISQIRLLIGL